MGYKANHDVGISWDINGEFLGYITFTANKMIWGSFQQWSRGSQVMTGLVRNMRRTMNINIYKL